MRFKYMHISCIFEWYFNGVLRFILLKEVYAFASMKSYRETFKTRFKISGCVCHPRSVLPQATNTEIKSDFKSNNKEWRATKTNTLTLWTTCGNTPFHNKQSHRATWGVMGAIHPQIHAVWAAALTLGRLFLLAQRPGEGIAEKWGNMLDMCYNFPHWASCWG